jgi:hypothetical protein
MSYNRNPYDLCTYKYELAQSVGPGVYQLIRPDNQCTPCISQNPWVIAQSSGVSISKNTSLIDIDSELLGITRNLSDCPDRKFLPNDFGSFHCGAQTGKVGQQCRPTDKLCIDNSELLNAKPCGPLTEDTRLSNPPATLRGTGWNRWEFLCMNPQDRVVEPFDFQINTKIVSKDNHRPCIPRPIDQFNVYPAPNNKPICETIVPACTAPTMPPSVSWQREGVIVNY